LDVEPILADCTDIPFRTEDTEPRGF